VSQEENEPEKKLRREKFLKFLLGVRSKIGPKTPYKYDVNNFTTDWNDGHTLAALVDALSGGGFPNHRELPTGDRKAHNKNCQDGIVSGEKKGLENAFNCVQDRAFDLFEVPRLLDGDDMANPKIDQNSMMTYISYFRNLDPSKLQRAPPPKLPGDDARNTRAFGPGLQREGNLCLKERKEWLTRKCFRIVAIAANQLSRRGSCGHNRRTGGARDWSGRRVPSGFQRQDHAKGKGKLDVRLHAGRARLVHLGQELGIV
jgi:hypothetical protein